MKTPLFFVGLTVGVLMTSGAVHAQDLLPPNTQIEQAIDHYVDEGLELAGVKPALKPTT